MIEVKIMDDDGEWVPVAGVTSFEMHGAGAADAALAVNFEKWLADLKVLRRQRDEMLRHALMVMAKELARIATHLQQAGFIDEKDEPTRPDRPAWQSPYGPPARHRR